MGKPNQKDKILYFISDLHISNSTRQSKIDHKLEKFLNNLVKKDNTELIIIGDLLNLWEMGNTKNKLKEIIKNNQKIFDKFKQIGSKTPITLLAGNHDHELLTTPKSKEILNKYNINLIDNDFSITRTINNKKIKIEHGHQYDPMNQVPDLKQNNPQPIGYFVSNYVEEFANSFDSKKYPWMKEFESLSTPGNFPSWFVSNYFYKELSIFIKFFLLPVLFVLSFNLISLGIISFLKFDINNGIEFINLSNNFGLLGVIIDILFWVHLVFLLVGIILSIPLKGVFQKIKTLQETYSKYKTQITNKSDKTYINLAKNKIFKEGNDVFIFGHTHKQFMKKTQNKVIINTGNWHQRLKKISVGFKLLPDIYYPYYDINYTKIQPHKNNQLRITNYKKQTIKKTNLSFLQKLLLRNKKILEENKNTQKESIVI